MLFFNFLHEGAAVTELIDEVVVVFGLDHFVVANDVFGVSDGGEDLDFVVGALL